MNAEEVAKKLKAMVVDQLGLDDESEVKNESRFVDDLNADSLDVVELVMAVEEEFNVEIPDAEVEEHLQTFGSAVEYIAKKLS